MENSKFNLKVGLFGIGLEAYWEQFTGLEDRLKGYINTVDEKFKSYQCEVVNLGLIDNPEKAIIAGHEFRKADVDIIFLYVNLSINRAIE
jgi:L-arabinose isomerase